MIMERIRMKTRGRVMIRSVMYTKPLPHSVLGMMLFIAIRFEDMHPGLSEKEFWGRKE